MEEQTSNASTSSVPPKQYPVIDTLCMELKNFLRAMEPAMAINGVYLGGGIAPKLLPKLRDGTFMKAFTNKGRYKRLMSQIPVHVVTNQHTALLGAASMAARLCQP